MSDPVHATCVAIGGAGVLIRGGSGSGKSDLALRLIDRGAMLVADDYVALANRDGVLIASPPPTIAGRIEVRGIGIVAVPFRAEAPVALAIRLGSEERLPEPATETWQGVRIPLVMIDPHPASAPIKVELALAPLLGSAA